MEVNTMDDEFDFTSEFDFTNVIRNPFADKFKDGYNFIIHHNSPNGGWDEFKFVKPEDMRAEIEKDMERYARENQELAVGELVSV